MRYSLTSALLVFFMFADIHSAHCFKNTGNEGCHKIIDIFIDDTL